MGRAGRVVVGVDLSLSGRQALRRAVAEARARGVPLHAVRAWTPTPAGDGPPSSQERALGGVGLFECVSAVLAN